jgi:hypothetical protein
MELFLAYMLKYVRTSSMYQYLISVYGPKNLMLTRLTQVKTLESVPESQPALNDKISNG